MTERLYSLIRIYPDGREEVLQPRKARPIIDKWARFELDNVAAGNAIRIEVH